jgi:hypothetical protein
MLPCGTFTSLVVYIVSPKNIGLHLAYSKSISVNVVVLKLIKQKGFLSCNFVLGEKNEQLHMKLYTGDPCLSILPALCYFRET